MNSKARINKLVSEAIPKGKSARIIWTPTGFSKSQILRVVTPAWKTLPRFQRISKLRTTLESNLSATEMAQIFRISVLTAQEFKRLREMLPREHLTQSKSRLSNGRAKANFA
ncbi:MAG: hypothetical protein C5B50_17350 [Verrucomicrobia bacterium]|nr:MAG: hypothetical protein C5B50_17350 [Verrucomicrobiota bacterium]